MSRRSMHREAEYMAAAHASTSMYDYSADEASDEPADTRDSITAVKSQSTTSSRKSRQSSSRKQSSIFTTEAVKSTSSSDRSRTRTKSQTPLKRPKSQTPVKRPTSQTPVKRQSSQTPAKRQNSQTPAKRRKRSGSSKARKTPAKRNTLLLPPPPANLFPNREFSDSTTRQGTPYGIEWVLDSKGRPRRRISKLTLESKVDSQETVVDHYEQENLENRMREFADGSMQYTETDSRLQYLYGLDGPDFEDDDFNSSCFAVAYSGDEWFDESDDEMYQNESLGAQSESIFTSITTTMTTIVTTIFSLVFFVPLKLVDAISAQFQSTESTRQQTGEQVTILGVFLAVISTVVTSIFHIISGLCSYLWWRVGGGAHGAIAQTVQSDVWLLSRTSRLRKRYGCCCLLPLLLLLPFILASSYYISERGMGVFPIFPILAANDSKCCVVNQGATITDEQLQLKVQAILMSLLADQDNKQQQILASQRQELNDAQIAALASHRLELEKMVHGVLKDELAVFTAAQSGKEQEYLQAKEAADAAARLSMSQASDESGQHYHYLNTQINNLGTQTDGKVGELNAQIVAVQAKADALSAELEAAKASAQQLTGAEREARDAAVVQLEAQVASLRGDVSSLQAAQAALLGRVGECCKNDSALAMLIKKAVQDEMALMMGGGQGGGGWFGSDDSVAGGSGGFMAWLSSRFAQQDDVDSKIAAVAARLTEQIEAIPTTNQQGQPDMMYMHDGVELTKNQVQVMIRDALLLYGADKTGQPDYALESAGGSVLSTRCSETYHRRTAQLSLFGIPLWYASNSPRSVIQPDVHPGQCWAFKGTQGYLVIQLAGEIYPNAFAMEHIPKALSPTGNIDSAPKDFSVTGLLHEKDTEGILLGNFTYQDNGEPLQLFAAKEPSSQSFSVIEVRIHSNHGNPEYTCLYRFRVHGNLRRW